MAYLVTINNDKAEHIEATEIKFDDGGGIQFYQLVVDEGKPNTPYKMLVKAYASGNWRTVIDQDLEGKKRAQWNR